MIFRSCSEKFIHIMSLTARNPCFLKSNTYWSLVNIFTEDFYFPCRPFFCRNVYFPLQRVRFFHFLWLRSVQTSLSEHFSALIYSGRQINHVIIIDNSLAFLLISKTRLNSETRFVTIFFLQSYSCSLTKKYTLNYRFRNQKRGINHKIKICLNYGAEAI